MTNKLSIACLLAAILAGGCGSDMSLLESKHALWSSQGADSYRFHFTRYCFCPGPYEVDILVEDGVATRVLDTESGVYLDAHTDADYFVTIEDLFEEAKDAMENADAHEIDFDPELGFPTRIFRDNIRDAVDDEVTYTAGDYVTIGGDIPETFGTPCSQNAEVCQKPFSCHEVTVPEFGDGLHAMCTRSCQTDFDCPLWVSPDDSPCPGLLNGLCREGFCNFTRCD